MDKPIAFLFTKTYLSYLGRPYLSYLGNKRTKDLKKLKYC